MKRLALTIALLVPLVARAASVQRWDLFELSLPGPADGNPFIDTTLSARFTLGEGVVQVRGCYDGDGTYRIRFMPPMAGTWRYETQSNRPELSGKSGEFICDNPSGANHGPVGVRYTYHFAYADGTPFKPIGTTSYGWVFQPEAMQDQTLATLKTSPFNKLRMCLLPIPYEASNDPITLFPFAKSADGKWDFTRFDPAFFQQLDHRIAQLRDLNVQADLILFNPYNRPLGFDRMSAEDDERFVRYVIARLSAYRNVWWSLANEYDLIRTRTTADWDRIGKLVQEEDPYDHLRSIHFSQTMYDPRRPWVTHLSVQNGNAVADFGRAVLYRDVCPKPVVYDEVCYEGDLDRRWGQLSGEEMTLRFWMASIAGTYCGHGETFRDPQGRSWTARGGTLGGTSPPRIAFLKKILDDSPPSGIEPIDRFFESNIAGKAGEYYLIYFGKSEPTEWRFELYSKGLSEGTKFHADVLDTWNMTITPVEKTFTLKRHDAYTFRDADDAKIELPGKPYLAIRIKRVE